MKQNVEIVINKEKWTDDEFKMLNVHSNKLGQLLIVEDESFNAWQVCATENHMLKLIKINRVKYVW